MIILAIVLFGAAIVRTARQRAQGGTSADTTVVTSDATDTTPSGKPVRGGTATEQTDTTSGKPSDNSSPTDDSDQGLKEIRPVTGDSTF